MLPLSQYRLNLANLPTPLQPLERFSEALGGPKIWLKRDDQTGMLLSGNKIRKLEFSVAQAKQDGADVLMTCGGVQSNHCRATALVAAQLGLNCHLILRGNEPQTLDGNTLLASLGGAEISYYSPTKYKSSLNELRDDWIAQYKDKGQQVYWIPTGASDEVGLWGYYAAAAELNEDFKRLSLAVDTVCCATGSGGTHAGLALGFHHLEQEANGAIPDVKAYAVCDSAAYFEDKAREDITAWYERYFPEKSADLPEIQVNDEYIGAGYAIANEDIYETIRWLAKTEGVVLDPVYTGKAFWGLVSDIKKGVHQGQENVVFVHTGGVYGMFPYREHLS